MKALSKKTAATAGALVLLAGTAAQVTMGCSCAGNPAGGLAAGNADVLGVTMLSIMNRANVAEDVNTIVFTSSDGYEIALPFYYVAQRFSLIAFDIAGEPVANSMGGTNQLWLGSTAANYFARDVATITFETREIAPPTPGTAQAGDTYANVPNISVTDGAAVA